jgi:hypothetical protein
MGVSAESLRTAAPAGPSEAEAGPVPRSLSRTARRHFAIWTAVFWGGVGVCAALFFAGVLEFTTSAKVALYGISVWLNGWLLAFVARRREGRSKWDLHHDALVIWLVSYAMTNVLWEIPWVILSPVVFTDLHTLDNIVANTGYMRSSLLHMYWWILASFGSVDLRTVNHDGTFYAVEMFAFVNVLMTAWFLRLNRKRSPYRYLIAVVGCGEPIAATFIFSFSEVFNGFVNMTGGVADTLLALAWTQYPYFLFPMVFGAWAFQLLREDLLRAASGDASA